MSDCTMTISRVPNFRAIVSFSASLSSIFRHHLRRGRLLQHLKIMLVLVLLLLRMLLVRGDRASDRFRGERLHAARTNLSTSRDVSGNPSLPISLSLRIQSARCTDRLFFFALTTDDRAFPLGLCLSKKATDGTARSVVRAAPRV